MTWFGIHHVHQLDVDGGYLAVKILHGGYWLQRYLKQNFLKGCLGEIYPNECPANSAPVPTLLVLSNLLKACKNPPEFLKSHVYNN